MIVGGLGHLRIEMTVGKVYNPRAVGNASVVGGATKAISIVALAVYHLFRFG